MTDQSTNWAPINGLFEFDGQSVTFVPKSIQEDPPMWQVGIAMSSRQLAEGTVTADIEFEGVGPQTSCDIALYYQPENRFSVVAGLLTGAAYVIRHFDGQQWVPHFFSGEKESIQPNRKYHVAVSRVGGMITMEVDGVLVGRVNLPWFRSPGQVGLWTSGEFRIHVTNFTVAARPLKAFVVMQFSTPFNELYRDVIKPVCEQYGVVAERADEMPGPGFIIEDVVRKIEESSLIIADITPANPNVFFEVGYAHALRKPTILIAERKSELPFDISGFRTLFYENSIAGKVKIEEGLGTYIDAIIHPPRP